MKLSKKAIRLKEAILNECDITDQAGTIMLEAALQAYDTMHKAQAILDKQNLTIFGDKGLIKAHPLLTIIKDLRMQFLCTLGHLRKTSEQ